MTTTDDELARVGEALTGTFGTRLLLVSPPRTGSTPVARMLWQHSQVTHHCHEPFEAVYWGKSGSGSVADLLLNPMDVASGTRVPQEDVPRPAGLLVKDMTFQLRAEEFAFLAGLATAPVVFVGRDPRLATTSRLRVVHELSGAETFDPFESGWQSLGEQVEFCRAHDVPYLVVDSADLRTDPDGMSRALLAALGMPQQPDLVSWAPRPELRLVAEDVGAMMSDVRAVDDPFYRRVLSSTGIQPVDQVDWDREAEVIGRAGLTDTVARWLDQWDRLREDGSLLRAGR
jgi:hypothetical protein